MSKICTNCQAENKEDSKYCAVCGYQLPVAVNDEVKAPLPEKKANAKKFSWATVIAFVVTFGVAYFATQYFLSPSIHSQLEKVAEEMNKTLPVKVDEYMTLEHVGANGKTIQYDYKLTENVKSEVNLDTVKKYVFSSVLENVKNNPEMEALRKNNVTFKYTYKDKNGVFVCDYVVNPEMYENNK